MVLMYSCKSNEKSLLEGKKNFTAKNLNDDAKGFSWRRRKILGVLGS